MDDWQFTDENYLLKRMAEIHSNVDNEWIISQLKANEVVVKKFLIFDEVHKMGFICQTKYATGWDIAREYEPEAESILLRLSEWKTVDALEKVIAEEFVWWFYLYDADDKMKYYGAPIYKVAARKIWNAWLGLKGEPPEVFADKVELPPRAKPIIIEIE